MAKTPTPQAPTIHRATLGSLGRVIRGQQISEAEAVAARRAGHEVVVCGNDLKLNRALAEKIEAQVGPYAPGAAHTKIGPYALPHFQPDPRPPEGHTFYETDKRKAARNP